jgi:ComF family protein
MIASIKSYANTLLQLFFPHNCLGCGSAVLNDEDLLCIQCISGLPETNFFQAQNNPVEKTFFGRLNIEAAGAAYYFTKDSLIQQLMIELKYKNNKAAGLFLGKMMGCMLLKTERFNDVDILIPLPLNQKKERKRGYNQAKIICDGIASVIQKPAIDTAVIRTHFTNTQTNQNRINRWQNMENVFDINNQQSIAGKHILLVDDVVTTGATLEACGKSILQTGNVKLSVATAAYTI